jgi:hypothetical protein
VNKFNKRPHASIDAEAGILPLSKNIAWSCMLGNNVGDRINLSAESIYYFLLHSKMISAPDKNNGGSIFHLTFFFGFSL